MGRTAFIALAIVLVLLLGVPPFLSLGLQNAFVSMLIASLFAVAFNLLVGQAGMLSFGHAAFYGIGAFAVMHLMLAVENGLAFPTPLLPLAGGLAGLGLGLVFGYFATIRSGVYFALVTLALAELLHSLAPQLQGTFGGEAGISSMRMPFGPLDFGSTLEVYYLTLFWTLLSLALLFAYTRTAFGRLTLALRENEQRVRFAGYNVHATKVVVFAISAMFSGVAGGLLAISQEVSNYTIFGMGVSSAVVLHTFIGGSTVFLGPAVGASLLTLFGFVASDLTRSWLLYQGIIFVLVMLYAPYGIGGIIGAHLRLGPWLKVSELAVPYALALVAALLLAAGVVFVIEAIEVLFSDEYAVLRRDAGGSLPPFELFEQSWSVQSPLTWAVPILLLGGGFWLLRRARAAIVPVWERAEEGAARAARDDDAPPALGRAEDTSPLGGAA